MSEYPESEKLSRLKEERGAVQEFLDWAEGEGMHLMRWGARGGQAYPVFGRDDIIYRWLEIDPTKLETERRAMLASMRGPREAGMVELDDGNKGN